MNSEVKKSAVYYLLCGLVVEYMGCYTRDKDVTLCRDSGQVVHIHDPLLPSSIT